MNNKFRLTLIHPAMGHKPGEPYIRAWQMETLPIASIAGLTPDDVELSFFDDRMERIDYDKPCDAVALSVETYTARRAYSIAAEYRKRGIPVVMGGFHATLIPDETALHADAVVIGEAEDLWPQIVEDLRRGKLRPFYRSEGRPSLEKIHPDRSVFRGKKYLPVTLIETGRGCKYACEFCAIGAFFASTRRQRPPDAVMKEILSLKNQTRLFFFVDDNFAADPAAAVALMEEMKRLGKRGIRWVTQMSLPAALDEEFLVLMRRSGCIGILVGLESLEEGNLSTMNKSFNATARDQALKNLNRHGIAVYGTFVFGYDEDVKETFDKTVDFAVENGFYIAAFNHLTPFPGTPLYRRLEEEGRLKYDAWWLNERYRYNDLAFYPKRMTPEEVSRCCVDARRRFYSWKNISRRLNRANLGEFFKLWNYLPINLMHRWDVLARDGHPLGNEHSS
ncbi:B12-binding domain-containing radical SAM protein [Synergistales bacterium]|nr:B12-binding domain-containing radical SAM protein [Synergistales bacterium]